MLQKFSCISPPYLNLLVWCYSAPSPIYIYIYINIYIYICYINICSEFIHWVLWRTLMRTEYFLFVYHTTTILAKLGTWCFKHSGGKSCSLLVNPSHTDKPWERRNCVYIYIYIYIWPHYQNVVVAILKKP